MKFDASVIQTLAPGQKITVPGFYNIPLEVHHNQPCDGVSVTSGTLRDLWIKGPSYVWDFHRMNPDRYEKPDTDAMRIGRAMAAIVEGGIEALEEMFMVLPHDKPNRPTAKQIAAWEMGKASDNAIRSIKFWQGVDKDKRDIITQREYETLVLTGGRLAREPLAQLLLKGVPEVTMAWFDTINDLWVLSRPDIISFDGTVVDYKRMSFKGNFISQKRVSRTIEDLRIDMQIALGTEAFENLTGGEVIAGGVLAQMAEAPYTPVVQNISMDMLGLATSENRRMRALFRECLDKGEWPGPQHDVGEYIQSEWMRNHYENLGTME